MTNKQDKWIERWLFNRLGEGNRFEQFNRQFCKDLINDYKPIIEKDEKERIFQLIADRGLGAFLREDEGYCQHLKEQARLKEWGLK